ncbi:hypothetical protein LMG22037_04896 [Paraburkholderia phenoliruptrix]|uniref:Uncharacterized protein n=1 Tax=Paraburkholderia phenoliruptrix TaxID=252970 RepID=A0A6J5C068_9BURK|nr:hypothetical protein [Paraburkholderia phenoliruptrix]CAB3722517.1 hypothetical protein LMG22037_04896 [Paraburkholderia phenoliruptrix]
MKWPGHRARMRDPWHEIERAARKAGRWERHRRNAVLYLCWTAMVLCAIWETIVCRLAVQALGSTWPLLMEAGLWAATLCVIGWDVRRLWRQRMAMRLYYEDIADGVCPDRGMQITAANGWKWYRRQGSPWWISSKRPRPRVYVADALARLAGHNSSTRTPQV